MHLISPVSSSTSKISRHWTFWLVSGRILARFVHTTTSAVLVVAWMVRRLCQFPALALKQPPFRALAVCFLAVVFGGYCLGERQRQQQRYEAWQRDRTVQAALAESVRILIPDAEHCTLIQAIELMREQVDVPIDVDMKLANLPIYAGHLVMPDGSVRGVFQGPLDDVLQQILSSAEGADAPDYQLVDGRIVIRFWPDYPPAVLVRNYESPTFSAGQVKLDERGIFHLITTCIAPDSWDDVGGPYSARESPGAVTVAASSQIHRQIVRMLGQLAALPEMSQSPKPVVFLDSGYPYSTSELHANILAALDRTGDFECNEQPLKEFLGSISERFQIPIVLSTKKLEEAAINLETPITGKMQGVSLRAFLRNSLGELGLTYTLEPEVMRITTPEDAGSRLILLLYPVHDLQLHPIPADAEKLIDVIRATVEPDSWDEVGGPGSVEAIAGGWLLVAQTQEAHEHLLEFLNQLRHDVPRITHPLPELARREQAIRRIQAKLCSPAILDLPTLPLDQFAAALEARLGVPVVLATKKLEEAAIDPQSIDICLDSSPQPLWRQLGEGLRPYGLSFLVRDEFLQLTTIEDAGSRLNLEIVDTRDLSVLGSGLASEQFLLSLLQQSVDEDSWEDVGGPASIISFRDCLVIQHDSPSLFEIREFLSWLRAHRRELPTPAEISSLDRRGAEYNRLVAHSRSSPDRWRATYLSFVLNPEVRVPRPIQRQTPACYSGGCFCF
jgi:hypothetical protein